MFKLYVGNLPTDVSEGALRQLFTEHGVQTTSVLVKRGGYAFVDCADQALIDRAIDKLNGWSLMGHSLVVEPSVAGGGAKRSLLETRVRVSGVSVQSCDEDLETLLSSLGEVEKCEKYATRDGITQVVHVTFSTVESAKEAVQQLNGYSLDGEVLRVERLMDRRTRVPRTGSARGISGMAGSPVPPQRHAEFPLRILVHSEMVGAIIGRQGSTIKAITQQTRARVDVHRKDGAGCLEKAITIYGNPENCTNACRRILEVMQEEAENTNKGDVCLKILAHNNLIGRIIGKSGTNIKKVMEDTNTRITVSSINDINSFNLERIITIRGAISDIVAAEAIISSKLRMSYENDLQAFAPQSAMFPGLHPMAMMSTVGFGLPRGGLSSSMGMFGSSSPTSYPPVYPSATSGGGGGGGPPTGQQSSAEEMACVYIPNPAVGAIIGTKGSHIRNMIRFSGASIKIASPEEGKSEQQERKVTVVGTPEAQWKAQFLLFEKIREEGYGLGVDDVRLTIEIIVPSSQVGRIIGKGGQNVRDLQRQTGSVIKLPQQNAALSSSLSEDTTVHIIGPFFSVQETGWRTEQ